MLLNFLEQEMIVYTFICLIDDNTRFNYPLLKWNIHSCLTLKSFHSFPLSVMRHFLIRSLPLSKVSPFSPILQPAKALDSLGHVVAHFFRLYILILQNKLLLWLHSEFFTIFKPEHICVYLLPLLSLVSILNCENRHLIYLAHCCSLVSEK